jgi:5-methyltetrahydrofolate--homocysteine methyltransferase
MEENMENSIQEIYDNVITGKRDVVSPKVQEALDMELSPEEILNQGLIAAMQEVGDRFERGEFYVPEMLIAARAMQAGLAILKPFLAEQGIKTAGTVVIGTVKGDLHDIGKNLVAMMLEGAGFDIIDLGTDVPPEKFAQAIREHDAQIVGMSALLTTTMQNMQSTIEAIEDLGVRESVKIVIGGAPVTDTFAKEIGADGYAPDASRAVNIAKNLLAS